MFAHLYGQCLVTEVHGIKLAQGHNHARVFWKFLDCSCLLRAKCEGLLSIVHQVVNKHMCGRHAQQHVEKFCAALYMLSAWDSKI